MKKKYLSLFMAGALLACSFSAISYGYYQISPNMPLKVYILNSTPYTLTMDIVQSDPASTTTAQSEKKTIPQSTDETLLYWKKSGRLDSQQLQISLNGTMQTFSFSIKFDYAKASSGNTLSVTFPSLSAPVAVSNFRTDEVPAYTIGRVGSRNLVLTLAQSQSYGTGVNQYGVVVFQLDLQ